MAMPFLSNKTSMPVCSSMAVKGWMPLTEQEKGWRAPAFSTLTVPKLVPMSSFSPVIDVIFPVYSPESK